MELPALDLVTLSVKLARRLGVTDVDEQLSPIEALNELQIVSRSARVALDVQRDVSGLAPPGSLA